MQKQLARKLGRIWLFMALCSICVFAQCTGAQEGFVSIDCGATKSYRDTNGLLWTPDETFVGIATASIVGSVAPLTTTDAPRQFSTIRYFPGDQTKYCYVLDGTRHGVVQGSAYLLRASFWAGAALPYQTRVQDTVQFKLLLNADVWYDVLITLPQANGAFVKEIYVVAMKATIDVCLSGKGINLDIPFISSLVLRPLSKNMTAVRLMIDHAGSRPLSYMHRINYGAPSPETVISYLRGGTGDDYDRVWQPDTRMAISTKDSISLNLDDKPPLKVVQTAYESEKSFNLTFVLPVRQSYHYALFFPELFLNVSAAGERVFTFQVLDDTGIYYETTIDPFEGGSLATVYSINPHYLGDEGILTFSFTKNITSIYGPIVCGLEILQVLDHDISLGTDDAEVATLKNVTSHFFRSLITWSGDPCLPYAYNWLTCTLDPRPFISNISLSNKALRGEIPTDFNKFKSLTHLSLGDNQLSGSIPDLCSLQNLEVLDLHNNSLNGTIPDYLRTLPSLTTLNLEDNNFSGEIPSSLLAQGSKIMFSVAGNSLLCDANNDKQYCKTLSSSNTNTSPTISRSPERQHNSIVITVVAAVGAAIALLFVGVLVYRIAKKRKRTIVVTTEPNRPAMAHPQEQPPGNAFSYGNIVLRTNSSLQFSFDAIKTMTRNFKRLLGNGGFGSVYYGVLEDETEIAVKVEGAGLYKREQQFFNEVQLLSRVHHKNLVSLVGYCIEGRLALVYEFMANGSLAEALHGNETKLVAWKDRLRIAVGASEGLEYLHQGCNPPIIHRDVKSGNILLGDQDTVKISDFGISKSRKNIDFAMTEDSQTLTDVQGTCGYLDPVYLETRVADRSIDVYAFGIVLFELVTGKPPIIERRATGGNCQHIVSWASPQIDQGDLLGLVDPTLNQDFNESSMWKMVELAMLCVNLDKRKRPTMSEIRNELTFALSMEVQNNVYDTNASDRSTGGFAYSTDMPPR